MNNNETRSDASDGGRSQEPRGGAGDHVRDVMTSNPETVREKDSIVDTARLMLDRDCGSIPVLAENGRKVVGIITDRDIVIRLVAAGKDLTQSRVADAMSRDAKCVQDDSSVDDAMQVMSMQQVRRLPVVDSNGELVGILAVADLAQDESKSQERKVGKTVTQISEK